MHHTKICPVSFAAIALTSAQFASAGLTTTTFDDRSVWETAAGGTPVVETFESEAIGFLPQPTTLDSGLGVSVLAGIVSTSIRDGDEDLGIENTTPNGRNLLWFDEDENGTDRYTAQFTLADDIRAFGFDLSGFQPDIGVGGTTISLLDNGSVVDQFFLPVEPNTFAGFFQGFIGLTSSEDFDEVHVQISDISLDGFPGTTSDTVGFDDVAWVVPSPGTAGVFAIAGGYAMRRRRRAS